MQFILNDTQKAFLYRNLTKASDYIRKKDGAKMARQTLTLANKFTSNAEIVHLSEREAKTIKDIVSVSVKTLRTVTIPAYRTSPEDSGFDKEKYIEKAESLALELDKLINLIDAKFP